jgi:hypothetical protein
MHRFKKNKEFELLRYHCTNAHKESDQEAYVMGSMDCRAEQGATTITQLHKT